MFLFCYSPLSSGAAFGKVTFSKLTGTIMPYFYIMVMFFCLFENKSCVILTVQVSKTVGKENL